MEKKKFRLATLGCRTNQYESQAYRDQLLAIGYEEAKPSEKADLCIVNTCTVTASADSSSRHQIRQLARDNEGAQVVVTGCLAERRPDLISSIEGVTHVVSNLKKEELLKQVLPDIEIPEFSIKNFESHTRAFVKVQDGCNSFCTYCIIPYVRGRSRSRTIAEVVKEVEDLIASGYQEVVITGINVGDFDGGGGKTLADLIRAVDHVDGLQRLRLSSIDPDEVNDDLTDAILNGKTTCHSLHIVLQAGSNVTLKRMNRKYTRQIFLDTVTRLKQLSPHFTFTTDVIVGFPGESDVDFEETLAVMREVKFAKVHMFPYSPRERTRAFLYSDRISEEVTKVRKKRVMEEAEKNAFELRTSYVGKRMKVLTESIEDNDWISGHTENFLQVLIPKGYHRPNQLVDVVLDRNSTLGLIGLVYTHQDGV